MEKAYCMQLCGPERFEAELSGTVTGPIRIGSSPGCTIVCSAALYDGCDFELHVQKENGVWYVREAYGCRICIHPGGVHAPRAAVQHGVSLSIRTQAGRELFLLSFIARQEWAGQDYARRIYLPVESGSTVRIGGMRNAQIYLPDASAARESVQLRVNHRIWSLRVERAQMKVLLNGAPVQYEAHLPDGYFLMIGTYSFFYKQGCLYATGRKPIEINGLSSDMQCEQSSAQEYPFFVRSARMRPRLEEQEITVMPPAPQTAEEKAHVHMQGLAVIAALCAAAVTYGLTGGGRSFVLCGAAALLMGEIAALLETNSRKKAQLAAERSRQLAYKKYIEKKVDEIVKARQSESEACHRLFRPAEENIAIVRNFDKGLFDRSPEDDDFLGVRLGTGSVPARRQIRCDMPEYRETDDPLMNIAEELIKKYRCIENAPVVSFVGRGSGIGVIGLRENLYEMLKVMTVDIAVRHDYRNVHMFYVIAPQDMERFAWTKWLRHCCGRDGRNIVCDGESTRVNLDRLYRELAERSRTPHVWQEHIVVFAYRSALIHRHPVACYIEGSGALGVHFIFFEEHEELAARGCREMIHLNSDGKNGTLTLCEKDDVCQSFTYQPIADETLMDIARKLFSVRIAGECTEDDTSRQQAYRICELNFWGKSEIVYESGRNV